jgi:hypothetical protein
MKKLFILLCAFTLISSDLAAQQFVNSNAPSTTMSYPLNNLTTGRKCQWFIPANSILNAPPVSSIQAVYLRAVTTGSMAYPVINIRLKAGTGSGLSGSPGGAMETGMTLVYSSVNQTLSTLAGAWIGFTLTTPFFYNSSLPVIVEVEHNATSGNGPFLYTIGNLPGGATGTQWADYNNSVTTATSAAIINFGIDIVACNGAPPSNSILPAFFSTCPSYLNNPTLSLSPTYSVSGITYQWQSSTVSASSSFNSITGASLTTYTTPVVGTTTWYRLIATCAGTAGGTSTLSPAVFSITPLTTSTVPYYEDFETIAMNDYLPNCSWSVTGSYSTTRTYTSSGSNSRVPHSGNKFASFYFAPSGQKIFYSNGVFLAPGITYSAAVWYITEPYTNFTNLTLSYGLNQSTVNLTPIASVSFPLSQTYQLLSGVFTTTAFGYHYIAVSVNSNSGTALYMSWDDLSVTIPCTPQYNSPQINLSFSPPSHSVCTGQNFTVVASGADLYSGGGPSYPITAPAGTGTYTLSVTGTDTNTGCMATQTATYVVLQSPNVSAIAYPAKVCSGKQVNLLGSGANSYTWSTGSYSANILVYPTTAQVYTLDGRIGICISSATVDVQVDPAPQISASVLKPQPCLGELMAFNASGGTSYQWTSDMNSIAYSGPSPKVIADHTGQFNFTVTATNDNGCTKDAQVLVIVDACTGLPSGKTENVFHIYPRITESFVYVSSAMGTLLRLELTDLSGRILLRSEKSAEHAVDMSFLDSGLYLLRVSDELNQSVTRIIRR